MKKIIKKMSLGDEKKDLACWLSKSPKKRIEAVEILRKQFNGSSARLQRTVRVVKQA